jgi:streptogrisin D
MAHAPRIHLFLFVAVVGAACGNTKGTSVDAGAAGGSGGIDVTVGTGGAGVTGMGGAVGGGGAGGHGGATDGGDDGAPMPGVDASGAGGDNGGAGGAVTPATCNGTAPPTPTIFGGPMMPVGQSVFTYQASGLTAPTVTVVNAADGSIQALQASVNPGATTNTQAAYLGFGLGFSNPACLDASAYDSVSFTIAGDLGTCRLTFSVLLSEDNSVNNSSFGRCTASSCYSPASMPLAVGDNVASFADFRGGAPVTVVDPSALNGVQWNLTVPTDGMTAPCVANFTISNVRFTVVNAPPESGDGGVADGGMSAEAGTDAPADTGAGDDASAADAGAVDEAGAADAGAGDEAGAVDAGVSDEAGAGADGGVSDDAGIIR